MITSIRSSKVPVKPVTWLWKPYVPRGMMTLVAGIPGEGKSLFVCWLAAAVSQKHPVLMSSSEDDYSMVIRPRLEAAGANMERVTLLDPPPRIPRDTDTLLRHISGTRAVLVVLDPLQDHLDVSLFSPKAPQVLSPVAKELARRGVSLVAVSHTIKSVPKNAHPLYAVGGAAGGISRVMRVVHILGEHPDGGNLRVLAPVKANFLRTSEKVSALFEVVEYEIRRGRSVIRPGRLVHRGQAVGITATMIVRRTNGHDAESRPGPSPEKRMNAADWLRELLATSEAPVSHIQQAAKEYGLSWATVRRADAEQVHAIKRRVGIPGRQGGGQVVWGLPQ